MKKRVWCDDDAVRVWRGIFLIRHEMFPVLVDFLDDFIKVARDVFKCEGFM